MRTAAKRTVRSSRQGGALLAVLWMAAALAAIGLSVATAVRTETEHVATVADGLRAHYLATGSVERAIQWMTWGATPRGPEGTPYWSPAMSRFYMSYPSGDAVVELIPESSKLNINEATAEDLTRVVAAVSGDLNLAAQIVAAILDWRSGLGAAPGGPSGAFNFGLNAPGSPTFRPRHASFEEIEELLFVRGVTPELFYGNYVSDAQGRLYPRGGLRDCLSVYGSQGPFDANTASPALLEAMGLSAAQVEALLRQRTLRPLLPGELEALGIANPRVAVMPGRFMWTIRATARLRRPDGSPSEVVRSAAALVKRWEGDRRYAEAPVHVLRFYEDAWSEFAVPPPLAPELMAGARP